MPRTVTAARFEPSTKTIRSVPENYWLASMDSWDGAVDHERNAKVMAASFEMLAVLKALVEDDGVTTTAQLIERAWVAIEKAEA